MNTAHAKTKKVGKGVRRSPRSATNRVAPVSASPLHSEFKADLDDDLNNWEEKCRPLLEEFRSSERLSESDLAIRINTRG